MQRTAEWVVGWLSRLMLSCALAWAGGAAQAQTVTYFHNDPAGTPLIATDAGGNVVWKEHHQPYGARRVNASSASGDPIGFAGKPFDAAVGLSYMGARYYDPVLGRFLGMDPAPADPGSVHGINRYAYANNNPYKYVDPDGHTPLDVAFLVWDIGKLGMAIYSGNAAAIAEAGGDVLISAVGVASPVPFAGQAVKAARAAEKAVEVGRMAERTAQSGKVADGVAAAKGGDKIVYRLGADKESASRLARKSGEAEQAGFPHGVSVSTTKPPAGTACSSASCAALEAGGMKVHHTPTRNDPNHHTVELPKPVTPESARAFNEAFGRR